MSRNNKDDQNFSVAGFSLKRDDASLRRDEALRKIERREQAQAERQQTYQMQADRNVVKIANVNMTQWEIEKEKRVHTAFDRIIQKEWYDKYEANLKLSEQNHINAVREHFAMRRDKIKTPCPSANYGFAGIGSHVPSHYGGGDVGAGGLNRSSNVTTTFNQSGALVTASSARSAAGRISAGASRSGPAAYQYNTAAVPIHSRRSTNNTMHALEWAENVDALDQLGSEGNFNLQDRFLSKVNKQAEARRRAEERSVFAAQEAAANQQGANYSLFPRDHRQ